MAPSHVAKSDGSGAFLGLVPSGFLLVLIMFLRLLMSSLSRTFVSANIHRTGGIWDCVSGRLLYRSEKLVEVFISTVCGLMWLITTVASDNNLAIVTK